jgi:hypothetical protein
LDSSASIRSAETMASRGASSVMAARSGGDTVKPSCAANLAARMIRSGSSLSEASGLPGVRSTFSFRSRSPENGSTNSYPGSRAAIAFTVKSRRARSSSSDLPYWTSGLRDFRS